ncbi:hypothetical protein ACOMHN_044902 [Nucella lapillus]
MILVKDCYNSNRVKELETNCEIVWVKLGLKGRRSLYICSYYRPDVSQKASLQEFETSVQRAANIPNAMLMIGGDLNFPGWEWSTTTLKPHTKYVELHKQLAQIIDDNGLEQMVTVPTREDDCEIFLLKAAEPSLPTCTSTAVCQDTAKATGSFLRLTLKSVPLKPVSLKSVSLKSVSLKPVSLKSVSVKPVSLKSVSLKSVSLKYVSLKPASLKPVSLKPVTLKSVGLKPVALNPVSLKSVSLKPVSLKPVSLKPVSLKPVSA